MLPYVPRDRSREAASHRGDDRSSSSYDTKSYAARTTATTSPVAVSSSPSTTPTSPGRSAPSTAAPAASTTRTPATIVRLWWRGSIRCPNRGFTYRSFTASPTVHGIGAPPTGPSQLHLQELHLQEVRLQEPPVEHVLDLHGLPPEERARRSSPANLQQLPGPAAAGHAAGQRH
eukprot:COSAG02_NODE_561_length_20308_cov_42.799495_11_plen_174_part_00